MRWWAPNGSSRNDTGTRRKLTSAGSVLVQLSSAGSNELQCGQPYQKNSITSILPPGGTGKGWPSLT